MSFYIDDYETRAALNDLKIFFQRINDAVDVRPTCVPQYSATIDSILLRMNYAARQHFMQVPNPHFTSPPNDWSVDRCRRFFVLVSESIETGLLSSRCIMERGASGITPRIVVEVENVHRRLA